MLKRHLTSVFIVISLLLAQQGAVWHALSHYEAPLAPAGHHEPVSTHADLCDLCHVFSQMGAAVSGPWAMGYLPVARVETPAFIVTFFPSQPQSAYLSRAPPTPV